MKDCTELANRTLRSIFDPRYGDFSGNMKQLDKALSARENQPKGSSKTGPETV